MTLFKIIVRTITILFTLFIVIFSVLMFVAGGGAGHSGGSSANYFDEILLGLIIFISVTTLISSWGLFFLKKWGLYLVLLGIFSFFILSMFGSQSIFWSSGGYPVFYPYIIPALLVVVGIYFYINRNYLD